MNPVRFRCSPLATAIRIMSDKTVDELEEVLASGAPSPAARLLLSAIDDGPLHCDPQPAYDEVELPSETGGANRTEST